MYIYRDRHTCTYIHVHTVCIVLLALPHRVIRMDQGHALLVGVGGSGRQSLARLAAFAAGCEVFEITLSRGYGEEEFREDLKQLYHKLGLENKKVGGKLQGREGEEGRREGRMETVVHKSIVICFSPFVGCVSVY